MDKIYIFPEAHPIQLSNIEISKNYKTLYECIKLLMNIFYCHKVKILYILIKKDLRKNKKFIKQKIPDGILYYVHL